MLQTKKAAKMTKIRSRKHSKKMVPYENEFPGRMSLTPSVMALIDEVVTSANKEEDINLAVFDQEQCPEEGINNNNNWPLHFNIDSDDSETTTMTTNTAVNILNHAISEDKSLRKSKETISESTQDKLRDYVLNPAKLKLKKPKKVKNKEKKEYSCQIFRKWKKTGQPVTYDIKMKLLKESEDHLNQLEQTVLNISNDQKQNQLARDNDALETDSPEVSESEVTSPCSLEIQDILSTTQPIEIVRYRLTIERSIERAENLTALESLRKIDPKMNTCTISAQQVLHNNPTVLQQSNVINNQIKAVDPIIKGMTLDSNKPLVLNQTHPEQNTPTLNFINLSPNNFRNGIEDKSLRIGDTRKARTVCRHKLGRKN